MFALYKTTVSTKEANESDWTINKINVYDSEGSFKKELQKTKDWYGMVIGTDNEINLQRQVKLICYKSVGKDWIQTEETIYG